MLRVFICIHLYNISQFTHLPMCEFGIYGQYIGARYDWGSEIYINLFLFYLAERPLYKKIGDEAVLTPESVENPITSIV